MAAFPNNAPFPNGANSICIIFVMERWLHHFCFGLKKEDELLSTSHT